MVKSCETIIQAEDRSVKMPTGLHIKYMTSAFDGGKEITEYSLKQLIKKIQSGQNLGVYLFQDPELEENYMQLEMDNGLIFLQYVKDPCTKDECFYSSFDPACLDSKEEAPMSCSDGQSVILKRNTMKDTKLAARCVEYFVRTGKLYPAMTWLKGWQVWE